MPLGPSRNNKWWWWYGVLVGRAISDVNSIVNDWKQQTKRYKLTYVVIITDKWRRALSSIVVMPLQHVFPELRVNLRKRSELQSWFFTCAVCTYRIWTDGIVILNVKKYLAGLNSVQSRARCQVCLLISKPHLLNDASVSWRLLKRICCDKLCTTKHIGW